MSTVDKEINLKEDACIGGPEFPKSLAVGLSGGAIDVGTVLVMNAGGGGAPTAKGSAAEGGDGTAVVEGVPEKHLVKHDV